MTAPHPTTKRWTEVPAPVCVHSSVQPMTDAEIRLMNEHIAARRAEFQAAIEAMNEDPDACDVGTELVTDEQDERNSRPELY